MIIINRVVKQRLRQTRVVKKLFKTNIRTPSDRRRDHRRAFDADTDADGYEGTVVKVMMLVMDQVSSEYRACCGRPGCRVSRHTLQ